MPQTIQQDWDEAKPITLEQEWETATPVSPGQVAVDPKKLTQGLVYSQTLNVSPSLAYDQSEEIEKQMQDRGAGSVWDIPNDIKVGAENSIFGLVIRGKMPEPLQDEGKFGEFVSGLSTMLADLPMYVFGAGAGLVAGEAVEPVGGGIPGAAMGTFAVPAMIRKTLVDQIRKGDIKNFSDLIERTAGVAWEGTKGAATGLGMEAAGAETLPAFGKGAIASLAKKAQQTAAITLLPKLLEGQIPTASDFGVNAALIGALSLVSKGTEIGTDKARQALMDAYAKDGTLPKELVDKLNAQPPVKPDLEPGLRPAIQVTRSADSEFTSTEVSAPNAATSGKVVLEGEDGDVHEDIAKRTGVSAVTMDQLERDHKLADKVLAEPDAQLQQVIDRAAEIKKEETGETVEPPKSGRGFITPEGRFLNREQAKSWVKTNEPEIHQQWADIAGGEKEEFHADTYADARERVANRTLAEGDPDVAAWSPQLARFVARIREPLNEIKADAKSEGYGKAVLRQLFLGPRNMLRAEAEQLSTRLGKLIPDFHDQEALTFLRDYKDNSEELRSAIEEIRSGNNEKLKAYIPSMERALTPSPELLDADRQMTDYFTNALGLARQLGTVESTIDPSRYSPRLFMKTVEDEDEARREGRQRFTTRTPHSIRREYLNILDPLKSGEFEARTFNALDELSVYGDRHATSAATSIFKTELKNTELGKNGSRSDVPSDWRELPGSHKTVVTKDAATGETQVFQQGFYVPKVVSDAMRPILEQNILGNIPGAWPVLRNAQRYIKATELGLSVFHMKALSLMGWSNMGTGDFVKAIRSDISSPAFEEAEREAALYGVETTMTGAPFEAYRGLKPTSVPSRMDVIREAPGVKQVDTVAQFLTHETFDVIQRKFKVMDFSLKQAAWLAKNPEATDAEYGTAMRGLGKEVNAVYGGLNWEAMGWGPNARELARAFLLAPDWTFSNFANLKYSFQGGAGGGAARAFWIKSAATGLAMTAATSLLFSGQQSKHPTEVYMGKDKQGKEIYSNIFFAGAPRDAITWLNSVQRDGGLTGTVDFMAFKAGPLLGIPLRLYTNRDWTGRQITTPKMGTLEKTGREAAFAGEEAAPVPFALKDIIEGMLNDSEHDYTYKDFLLATAGATATHEGGKKSRSQRRRKFSLAGR